MTLEEMQEQIIKMQEEMQTLKSENEMLKSENEKAITRQRELEEHNQKLFLRVTNKIDIEEKEEEEDGIPLFLDKETYKLLDKFDKEFLNNIMEGEE